LPDILLFFIATAFAVLGAFNRFGSAPLLCAFLILGFPGFTGSALPDRVPILITLMTQVLAFGVALFHYARLRCVAWDLARRFTAPAAVFAVIGSLLAYVIAGRTRLTIWAVLLLGVVVAWWRAPSPAALGQTAPQQPADEHGPKHVRRLMTTDGATYVYVCTRQAIGLLLASLGALVMGLTSFGLGEVETVNFAIRCRIPLQVAAATGLAVALGAATAAAGAHLLLWSRHAALDVPLRLAVITGAGTVLGTELGRRIARLVSTEAATRALCVLLGGIALWTLGVALRAR
jgi:uncharacterized membrane protein YfcA